MRERSAVRSASASSADADGGGTAPETSGVGGGGGAAARGREGAAAPARRAEAPACWARGTPVCSLVLVALCIFAFLVLILHLFDGDDVGMDNGEAPRRQTELAEPVAHCATLHHTAYKKNFIHNQVYWVPS